MLRLRHAHISEPPPRRDGAEPVELALEGDRPRWPRRGVAVPAAVHRHALAFVVDLDDPERPRHPDDVGQRLLERVEPERHWYRIGVDHVPALGLGVRLDVGLVFVAGARLLDLVAHQPGASPLAASRLRRRVSPRFRMVACLASRLRAASAFRIASRGASGSRLASALGATSPRRSGLLSVAALRIASRCASGSRLAAAFRAACRTTSGPFVAAALSEAARRPSGPFVAAPFRAASLRFRLVSSVSVTTTSSPSQPLRARSSLPRRRDQLGDNGGDDLVRFPLRKSGGDHRVDRSVPVGRPVAQMADRGLEPRRLLTGEAGCRTYRSPRGVPPFVASGLRRRGSAVRSGSFALFLAGLVRPRHHHLLAGSAFPPQPLEHLRQPRPPRLGQRRLETVATGPLLPQHGPRRLEPALAPDAPGPLAPGARPPVVGSEQPLFALPPHPIVGTLAPGLRSVTVRSRLVGFGRVHEPPDPPVVAPLGCERAPPDPRPDA